MIRSLVCVFVLACCVAARAAQPVSGPELDQRLRKLETELRCLVCQNQTLADSAAGLAEDLRREVRELAEQGKSDDEIKEWLKARYGDFVLYKPPVQTSTWLLWFGPFVLLLGGAGVLVVIVRKRASVAAEPPPLSEEERRKTEQLLS